MSEITMDVSFKMKCIRVAILILGSVLMSANVFSYQQWNRSFFDVIHSIADDYIEMQFKFFNYDTGSFRENSYLEECYIQCSVDNNLYYNLLKVTTKNQRYDNWTWMLVSDKFQGIKIQFGRCYVPGPGIMWEENTNSYRVEVYNTDGGKKAWFNLIWHLEDKYQNIKYIRLFAKWRVNGLNGIEHVNGVVFPINKFIISESKTPVTVDSIQNKIQMPVVDQPENNEAKISKNDDAIVIKGTVPGQNIKVYTTSGALVNSIIANDDLVKIPLTTKQIYIVQIGQTHYKVSL